MDDTLTGRIVAINGDRLILVTPDGFQMEFAPSELVHIGSPIAMGDHEAARAKRSKEEPRKRRVPVPRRKERTAPKMEVDLHIGQLVKSEKGLGKHDILTLQVETARRRLEFAMQKGIQKVVFIHGVGTGVLREELGYLFRRYEGISFYDADYRKYGQGATEVYIHQKARR